MLLIGIIAKKKDVQSIKKELQGKDIEIIEITTKSIQNMKNVKFEEIIFMQNIKLREDEYKYMNEIISKSKYLIINGDIEIDILKNIKGQQKIKLVTFGFNTNATISISSINDEKMMVYFQSDIEKENGEILERQEKQIINKIPKKIYNNFIVFIINELHNL